MKKQDLENGLEEFLIELKYNEKSENTLKKYRCNIGNFINWINSENEITKDITLEFKKFLIESKFETSTINSYIISINKFLKWLGERELTIKQIKQQKKSSLEEILSISDYKRLLRFAKSSGRNDIYFIMKILAMTGIRISELKYFTVEALKSPYIKVTNKGKQRNIVLRQDLLRDLRKYCREGNVRSGYLFPGQKKGKMISESTIWRNMQRIAGIAKIKKSKVHAHSFRHLFAKIFLNEYPGKLTELADILGHNSLETTRIYTRSTDEEKRRSLESIKF